jgi:hypothetical protein
VALLVVGLLTMIIFDAVKVEINGIYVIPFSFILLSFGVLVYKREKRKELEEMWEEERRLKNEKIITRI